MLFKSSVFSCQQWVAIDYQEKVSSFTISLAEYINLQCKCDFPSSAITHINFSCIESMQEDVISATAEIILDIGLNSSQLKGILQKWKDSHSSLTILKDIFEIVNHCLAINGGEGFLYCTSSMPEITTKITIGSVSGSVFFLLAITFLVSFFALLFYRKKR